MVPQEGRIAHLDQWIIHLEIKHVPDSTRLHLAQHTRFRECGESSTVPVWTQEEPARLLQKDSSRCQLNRRHCSLLKKINIAGSESKVTFGLEILPGISVSCRTGHDEKRHRAAIASRNRQDLFGMDAEQRCVRYRTD